MTKGECCIQPSRDNYPDQLKIALIRKIVLQEIIAEKTQNGLQFAETEAAVDN